MPEGLGAHRDFCGFCGFVAIAHLGHAFGACFASGWVVGLVLLFLPQAGIFHFTGGVWRK
jgi:hypothetical protein